MRKTSFGESTSYSFLEKFGTFLSTRQINKLFKNFDQMTVADFGCGYNAALSIRKAKRIKKLILLDVKLNPSFQEIENIECIEGYLPHAAQSIPEKSIDFILLNNVLEHVVESQELLIACHRLLNDQGLLYINVPSWFGKNFLEFAAFKLRMSNSEEIMDHKNYYNKKDLWPLLVRAGFNPKNIKMKASKFFMNTTAYCKISL